MDFDYKKHSLEHLEEWLHDALDCEDVTPQEIYETITNSVDENIETSNTLYEIMNSIDAVDVRIDILTGEKWINKNV